MAIIVEDGTGLPNSESYVSVSDATTYHANRGNSAWTALATDALREQALRKATDYLMQAYRSRWKGYRTKPSTQALDWPRQGVVVDDAYLIEYVDDNIIPDELKNACCELALKSVSGELAPDIERETASETVGSLSVSYFQGSKQHTVYRAIDMMLRPLLKNGGSGLQIQRA